MSKKIFKDTNVIKFLTDKVPSIVGLVRYALPMMRKVLTKRYKTNLTKSYNRKELELQKMQTEIIVAEAKRWQSGMQSDSLWRPNNT